MKSLVQEEMGMRSNLVWSHLSVLIAWSLLGGGGAVQGEEGDIRSAVNSLWKQPLSPIEEIIPGYHRPAAEPPSLLIANLRYRGTDGLRWGKVIGGLLRWSANYRSMGLLTVPDTLPVNLYYDLGVSSLPKEEILESTASLRVAYERMGIENGLCGEVKIGEASFSLQSDLIDLPTGRIKHSSGFKGSLEELPGAVSQLALETFQALGVELPEASRAYLAKPPTASFAQLKQYVEVLTASSVTTEGAKGFAGSIRPLLSEGANLPASLIPLLVTEDACGRLSLDRYREIENEYTSRWPGDSGIQFYLARYRVVSEASQ